jgi:NADPH:quinone reductase-like Zn-dependent oxidoreductase
VEQMKALRAHVRGGPEVLEYEDAPVPVPGPGEVLVAVHATGITFAELTWDLSWTDRSGADRTPVIPGHEVSGVVAGLGDGASRFVVGDEVYGLVDFDRDGAAAQYVTVPEGGLALKPRSVSHVQAASLALAALTAWQALVDHAELKPGQRVLIHGGAGGVGVYAVQLAADLGAEVIATGDSSAADFVGRLGAARFVDYTRENFDQVLSGVDVVLDAVGGNAVERSFGVLRRGGRLISLSSPPSAERAAEYGVTPVFFVVRPEADELAHLAELVDEERLRPIVSQTFPLNAGRLAFQRGTLIRRPGKTVLVVR